MTQLHSHANGYEHMLIHKPHLWDQLAATIDRLEPAACWRSALTTALQARGWSAAAPEHLVRDRISVELHSAGVGDATWLLFARPLAMFVGNLIDVGVEVLPMKSLQAEMSSGVPYYEGALYDLMRQGRGVPAVPLVLVGIAP